MKNYWRMKNKMLLLGYRDYPDVCSEITKMIEEGIKEENRQRIQ